MNVPTLLSRFLIGLLLLFLGAEVFGANTTYVIRGVAFLVLFGLVLGGVETRNDFKKGLSQILSKNVFWIVSLWLTACVFLVNWYVFDSFDGTLWDLTNYIQSAFHASQGKVPYTTIMDRVASVYDWHFSLSVPLLGFIFKYVDHPGVVVFWQSFFIIAPAWVSVWVYLKLAKKFNIEVDGVGLFLSFFTFYLMPTFSGQLIWPYVYHISGMVFFALSFWFWFLDSPFQWLICLTLFVLQKEEFGLFASSSALVVLIDRCWIHRKNSPSKMQWAIVGIIALVSGVAFYSWYSSQMASVIQWSDRFGNLGANPKEALFNLFVKPSVYWEAFSQTDSRNYILFFLISSLVWFKRRWNSIRYLLPVVPFILLYSVSRFNVMHLLKDHYAWPVVISLWATLMLGQFAEEFQISRSKWKSYALLASALIIFAIFGHGNPVRTLKKSYRTWRHRAPERTALATLALDRSQILCCEDKLCSRFSDRDFLIPVQFCKQGSQVLKNFSRDSRVRYLIYAWSPDPQNGMQWELGTSFLKLSAPLLCTTCGAQR